MKEVEITIKGLHDFFSEYPEEMGNVLVEGKDGWFNIDNSAITAPNSLYYTIRLENGMECKCSPDHLLFNGDWIKCKELVVGNEILTEKGYSKISMKELSGERSDLYDIEVRESQNYYGNGILSHNSTISNVITFGLYGRLEGKKIKDIPNRINGAAWMRITFEQYGDIYVVERGISPNIFNLYINGAPYDQAGVKNIQEYLSDDILNIPYYVFNNTISLSINDFKSFLKMSPSDKKMIIDKIFGFYILNEMRDLLKEESKNIRLSLERIIGEISSTSKSITSSQREMEDLSNRISQNSEDKVKELEESLKKFMDLSDIHREKLREFREKEEKAMSLVRDSLSLMNSCESEIRSIESKISLYKKEKCPTCSGDFKTEFYTSLLSSLEIEKEKLIEDLSKYKNQYENCRAEERNVITLRSDLISKGSKIESSISSMKNEILRIKNEKTAEQMDSLNRIISGLKTDLEEFNSKKFRGEERQTWIKTLDEVLGERGVKQLAIKSILPALNKQIMEIMMELHLPYNIIFNEEFNASIYHMGEEISTQTLSTGEMKKVDFAVLISIIKLMKIRFSTVNLLFLDEIFSSVDPDGVHSILNTLRKICDEMGINIFVINHAPMPTEIFDWKIEIQKSNNFSDLKMERTD